MDTCKHKHVIEIKYDMELHGQGKYWYGYCTDCDNEVFGQTGKYRIPWTTDRNKAFGTGEERKPKKDESIERINAFGHALLDLLRKHNATMEWAQVKIEGKTVTYEGAK